MELGKTQLGLALLIVASACGDDDMSVDAGFLDTSATEDSGPDAGPPPPPEISTPSGTVAGRRGVGWQEYLGIPYAEPPVGDLRFAMPVPAAPWTETLDATSAPARCVQAPLGFDLDNEEDCLYLNVHTPDPLPENAPVMVWIHGGAFIFGEGLQTDGGTRGDLLAANHGVVVVSMNYRLGPFGFLAHPSLAETPDGPSGNYAMRDQQLALEWVRDHIASFGGNPDDVTLFGESAGGISVCLHLAMPSSAGLFHKAISQSGLCDSGIATRGEAEASSAAFVAAVGCDDATDVAACLRGLDLETIESNDPGADIFGTLAGGRSWWPFVDGALVPRSFREAAEADQLQLMPTLLGWNADEGTLFVMLAEQAEDRSADETDYMEITARLAESFEVDVEAIRAQYPIADYPDPGAALAKAIGHSGLACPSRRAAGLLGPRTPTYVYRFSYPDPAFQLGEDRELGAFHSGEIQYVFGHPNQIGRRTFRGDDLPLHEAMSAYWARFAWTGDPNGDGAAEWPRYEADAHLNLDRTIVAGTGADADDCALWE